MGHQGIYDEGGFSKKCVQWARDSPSHAGERLRPELIHTNTNETFLSPQQCCMEMVGLSRNFLSLALLKESQKPEISFKLSKLEKGR